MAATRSLTRSLLLSRSFAAMPPPLHRHLLVAAAASSSNGRNIISPPARSARSFSTRQALNDVPISNWARPDPKELVLIDGCDFEHWLVVIREPPDESWTRDQIIDHYIKTLAQVVGSEEEARMKIYSVSTRHYFAFGALVSEQVSYKIDQRAPGVRYVLPDSYMNVENEDYGGEPFIDGQAVPYDPKYHEEWVSNNPCTTVNGSAQITNDTSEDEEEDGFSSRAHIRYDTSEDEEEDDY